MDKIGQFFEWHYLPFIISFGISLIMLLFSQIGGSHHGSHGHPHHDLHHNLHHDLHHAHHHFGTHNGSEKNLAGELTRGMGLFGVGKVPLSTLIFSTGLVWGLLGFIANMLLQPRFSPIFAFVIASSSAWIVTLLFTHILAKIFSYIVPPEGRGARQEVSLLGEIGTSQSSITTESGMVLIKSGADTFRVKCRIKVGEEEIDAGQDVQLVEYQPNDNLFYVQVVAKDQLPKPKIQLLERS